jgi:hypothetical protein
MMFQNALDQDKICQILKAYMEEWGTENVIVSLPKQWREYGSENVAGVRFEFSTSDVISIRAEYNNAVSVHYEYQLCAA